MGIQVNRRPAKNKFSPERVRRAGTTPMAMTTTA